jgi:hypothetical protein
MVVVHMADVALSLTTAVTVASRRMACVALAVALRLEQLDQRGTIVVDSAIMGTYKLSMNLNQAS